MFPGTENRELNEFDATGPVSAYGTGKLAGEQFVRDFADHYFIIRTAWLYGEGKNFVRTMLKLSETNEKVRVVKDQIGNPTSAKELAAAIAYLLPTDNYGLFHGTCEEAVRGQNLRLRSSGLRERARRWNRSRLRNIRRLPSVRRIRCWTIICCA